MIVESRRKPEELDTLRGEPSMAVVRQAVRHAKNRLRRMGTQKQRYVRSGLWLQPGHREAGGALVQRRMRGRVEESPETDDDNREGTKGNRTVPIKRVFS
jgi:hypothetical protein